MQGQKPTYTELVLFEAAGCLPRFVVTLRRLSPLRVIADGGPFLGALQPVTLPEACHAVYVSHLGRPYTLPMSNGIDFTSMDWEYTHGGVTVPRPNHGLAHTLRTMAYLPFCVEVYLTHTPLPGTTRELIVRGVPAMQLALLFYVSCRQNDCGSDDAEAYGRFRANSAAAFADFVRDFGIVMDTRLRDLCVGAVRMRGYDPVNWVLSLMTMAHDLDLLRCANRAAYVGPISHNMRPFTGVAGLASLHALAERCIRATTGSSESATTMAPCLCAAAPTSTMRCKCFRSKCGFTNKRSKPQWTGTKFASESETL